MLPQGEDGTAKKKKKKATGNDFYRIVFKVHQYFEPEAGDLAAGACVGLFRTIQSRTDKHRLGLGHFAPLSLVLSTVR